MLGPSDFFNTLRKHAYAINCIFMAVRMAIFGRKIATFFLFFAQNILINGKQKLIFLTKNKKANGYPCKPQFDYISPIISAC